MEQRAIKREEKKPYACEKHHKTFGKSQAHWSTPLISAFNRHMQVDLSLRQALLFSFQRVGKEN